MGKFNSVSHQTSFWLPEISTNSSAATAVTAVFSELQRPPHYCSSTALIQLCDTYMERFQSPESEESTHTEAFQPTATHHTLYNSFETPGGASMLRWRTPSLISLSISVVLATVWLRDATGYGQSRPLAAIWRQPLEFRTSFSRAKHS